MKDMGRKWSHLPDDEKKMFNEAAAEDKERYNKEMKELNIQGGKENNIQDIDAGRPKKCLSAYMIFVRETRPKIVREQKQRAQNEESKCSPNDPYRY